MDLKLSGKTALVTGSSRGIGRAVAEALRNEGCRVAINSRHSEDLQMLVAEVGGLVPVPGDVTEAATAREVVAAAVRDLGRLDILVCNVGSGRSVPPGQETPDEWQRVFSLNLWSATNMVEAARAELAASKGAVVCVSSICGCETVPGAPVTYSAAKAALNAYVKGIARPLAAEQIRIAAVAPGNVLTEQSTWSRRLAEDPEGVSAMLEREVALRRLGTPEEVAALVVFLASAAAAFATGQVWTLDGGQARS